MFQASICLKDFVPCVRSFWNTLAPAICIPYSFTSFKLSFQGLPITLFKMATQHLFSSPEHFLQSIFRINTLILLFIICFPSKVSSKRPGIYVSFGNSFILRPRTVSCTQSTLNKSLLSK